MFDTVIAAYQVVSPLVLIWTSRGWYYDYLHFTEEEGGTVGFSNLPKIGENGQI